MKALSPTLVRIAGREVPPRRRRGSPHEDHLSRRPCSVDLYREDLDGSSESWNDKIK